jgi:hypothetical protein
MAHNKCAHFIVVVCLNAPSIFGQKIHPCDSQSDPSREYIDKTYRKLTDGRAAPHELAPSAQPLTFWDEGHAITLLMHSQVTSVTEYYRIGVFTITVIANGAFRVLLLALPSRLTVNSGCTARSWTMRLRGLGVRFRYAFNTLVSALSTCLNLDQTYASLTHAIPSQSG